MKAQVVDLTGASSDAEETPPQQIKSATVPRPPTTRQPLSDVKNGTRANATPATDIPPALIEAINTMDADRLRKYVRDYCLDNIEVRKRLAEQLLVTGKHVVRYHADSDSEEDVNSENESSEEKEEDGNADEGAKETGKVKPLKPISVGDDEFVPRFAKCENCEQEFDVSDNHTRKCRWHTGGKELYEDDDFWADHDDQCHGDPHSFEDDPDFAEGFQWNCCDNLGDHEGCMTTKHKAPVNIIQTVQVAESKKRRAEKEFHRPVYSKRRHF
ncbi:hypothetical protein BKA64DRAFT_437947 [Cadophora sp. MPI-SDFR-AT-0126]|nr:hypothetical protein BKA64DRAFT_437947 [Leotiomycetes sp. MPI-SDFR-AT-0126]